MKILKRIIVLISLITLINANMSAQIIQTPIKGLLQAVPLIIDVEMEIILPPEPLGPVYSRTEQLELLVEEVESKSAILAIRIYDVDGTLLHAEDSQNPVTFYDFYVSISGDTGDERYIECGFKDNNGNYHRDSGCTVVIEPLSVTVVEEGAPPWLN